MGILVREMLECEFFKGFVVLAGHKGLDKPIQGVAILDAPDGFKWTKGRELVISSGYVFKQNPGLLDEYIENDIIKKTAGLAIKVDRYLKEIPQDIIYKFDKYEVPLIKVPVEPSWMDIMNQLNVLVMNKNIKQFRISTINPKSFSNLTYQARKINKILSQIENEMNFSAMLYDLFSEKTYYSSHVFVELAEELKSKDFWNPSFDHTKEILCDNLKIIRYRFVDEKYDRPYSWITIPITVGDKIRAYFVILEATDLIDYFDQFALRIGFLLLQSLYEQVLVAQSLGDMGFEKFMIEIIEGDLLNHEMLVRRAIELGLDINSDYYLILMNQINKKVHISSYKDEVKSSYANTISNLGGRMAVIDENSCLFFIPVEDKISDIENLKLIKETIARLQKKINKRIDKSRLIFGISDIPCSITEIKRSYCRTEQAIRIGKLLYPNEDYLTYSSLGAFAWMDIKDDEMDILSERIKLLIKNDENKDLIKTLRTYLESNMNYSITAKKLFLHINTVRNRIDNINDLISCDLENPMDRLKLEILLRLI